MPNCGISTDVIAGFCGETEEQHQETLSLMQAVQYDFAYMFYYSERPKTLAERKYEDDVPIDVKKRRLNEIIDLQMEHSLISNKKAVNKTHKVLIEGYSKRSKDHFCGRNTQNVMCVFPTGDYKIGDYVNVHVTECTAATLMGEIVD